jgi:predicted RNA methylase
MSGLELPASDCRRRTHRLTRGFSPPRPAGLHPSKIENERTAPDFPRRVDVLRASTVAEHVVKLPRQLDRKVYEEVDEALSRIGGKWNRRHGGHLFPYDPSTLLDELLASETLPPKNPNAFFPTPLEIAEMVIDAADQDSDSTPRVLEPSAGQGALAQALLAAVPGAKLDLVEADPWNAAMLRRRGWTVHEQDFLTFRAADAYDAVVMNPPFSLASDRKAYITHILHAWSMVAENGILVAVAPMGFTYGSDRRTRDFLHEVQLYGEWTALPDGAFKASGTGAATVLITMQRTDESWRDRPYNGFPSWHSFTIDLIAKNEFDLDKDRTAILKGVTDGKLALDRTDPRWDATERRIRTYLASGVEASRRGGAPVRPSEADLDHLVRRFVDDLRADLQLFDDEPELVDQDAPGADPYETWKPAEPGTITQLAFF